MTVYSVLIDFTVAAILIFIGQVLRSKVVFFQKYFVPASLIAGFIGLALGKNGLGVLPFSDQIGDYSSVLILIIFSSVGLNGFSLDKGNFRKKINKLGSYMCYRGLAQSIQFVVPIVFSILVISRLVPTINYGFGLLLAAGFLGGHGTAAAVGNAFGNLGWTDAIDLGMTSATVGILSGVFGGIIFIKWATKHGYTEYLKSFSHISGDLKTGMISKENRGRLGTETLSSVSLDPLAWHLALLLIPSGIGYMINSWIAKQFGLDLPTYTISFLVALAMFLIISKTWVHDYVDNQTISRISNCATDYLVFFGVASIKIPVVVQYALPFTLLMVCGVLLVAAMLVFVGPYMNKEEWFERSIFVYGYSTGVFAIGLVLLRIADPRNESEIIADTAIVSPINTPIELLAWSIGPVMLLGGQHWTFVGIFTLITIGWAVLATLGKWWYFKVPLAGRGRYQENENG